ncbi:MAG: ACT domain-containing protein [Actinomycetota bacterium]|nr:ACT domain-containing protein [Actinomycetota bacterium]
MGNPVESPPNASLRLSVLEERLAVCRLDPPAEIPAWATGAPFFSVTRTSDELLIVCPEEHVPPGITCERGWRALRFDGPFEFGLVGVLASVAVPLAQSEVSILAVATYDTDYVLVEESQLPVATWALREWGHEVR